MVIQSIASSYQSPASQAKTTGKDSLGKDDFLKLLVTQLQKQDPLNPSDPTEFTSQLAQYSSLEQLISVNSNLGSLGSQNTLNTQMTAASLIGKTVRINGSNISLSSGTANSIRYSLADGSAKTTATIYNADNDPVAVVDLGQLDAGTHDFKWDGKLANGSQAADGQYRYKIVATDANGQAVDVTGSTSGRVTGVSFNAQGQTMLEIGGATYSLGDVLAIGETAA